MQVDSRIARAVVRELPDVFRPDWVTHAWSGEFGALALRPQVTSIDTTLTLGSGGLTGTSRIRGTVLGTPATWLERLRTGGDQAVRRGSFAQSMVLHDSGRLEAHHSLLKVQRGFRGSGFGSELAEHGRAAYEAAGVDDVTMFAGMSVGGYAWARQGLELATTEVDDAARTLDRGRQVTAMVDESRRLVHVAGRFPRLRTLSDEQYQTVASRLVRGDVVPEQAITSVEELASIPEVGRQVLLGRVFRGSAELTRSVAWWQRAPTAAAEAVPSYRTDPGLVLEQSRVAARRIAAQLPAAADPFRAQATFSRHLAGTGAVAVDDARDAAKAVLRLGMDESSLRVTTTVPLRTATGTRIELTVAYDGARLVATEHVPLGVGRGHPVRQALDAAWRELGVEHVRSARTAVTRTVPAAG